MSKFTCYDETCDKRIRKSMKPLTQWPAKWLVSALIGSGCLGGVATFGWRWIRTPYVLEQTQADVAKQVIRSDMMQSNLVEVVGVLKEHGYALTNLAANAQRSEQWQLNLTKGVTEVNLNVARMAQQLQDMQGNKK